MIAFALVVCAALSVNALFAAAGLTAARRYAVQTTLVRGAGAIVLAGATAAELGALALRGDDVSTGLCILAFGAAAAGAACDAASGYVFDAITLPCLGAMAVYGGITHTLPAFLMGAGATGGSLTLLYALTRGRGLGGGDVKLAFCIGGGAGVAGGVEALGIAFILGGVYAGYLLLTKRGQRGDALRFAPYMVAGMVLAMLAGSPG